MPITLPPAGLDPRYFHLYEEGIEYGHRRHGEIAALGCYLEASAIHPEIPNAHFGAWERLEALQIPPVTKRLLQLHSARKLVAASEQVLDSLRLATTLSDLRRHNEVVSVLAPLREEAPADAMLHGNLATALRFSGRAAEAVELYQRAIELEPAATRRHHWLTSTYWEMGRHAEAIAAFDSAPPRPVVPVATRAQVAWSFQEIGDLKRADIMARDLESILYGANDDHIAHSVPGALIRVVRARLAAERGDDATLQATQSEMVRQTPWFASWLERRGLLEGLTNQVVPSPELDMNHLLAWCSVEQDGQDGTEPLRYALETAERHARSEDDIDGMLMVLMLRGFFHAGIGEQTEGRSVLDEVSEYKVEGDPTWPKWLSGLNWTIAMAGEDPEHVAAATEEADRAGNPFAPLMRAYAALLDGKPADIGPALDRLHATLDLPRPSRPVVADPFAPVYSVGRNEPCPCGSGLKYKRCHGR